MNAITKHLPSFKAPEWFKKKFKMPGDFKPVRVHRTAGTVVVIEQQRFDGKMVLVLRNWIHYPDLANYSCYLHNKLVLETEESEDMARWVASTMAPRPR